MRYLTALIAALALSGCVSSNLTQLTEALAKDPATSYISVASVYGTISVCRNNSQTSGGEITASGSQCTVKSYAPGVAPR